MLFNSLVFLYFFLPPTLLGYYLLTRRDSRFIWLTGASYIFYGFWNYRFVALMLLSTLVSYTAGLGLAWAGPRAVWKKVFLVVPIVFDLTMLGFFKYFNFGMGLLERAAEAVHRPFEVPDLHIILPIGISFYTFHTISYMVDCYRGTTRPTRNFFEFACYVSLFSQLVAGPIVRFQEVKKSLESIQLHRNPLRLDLACWFFVLGLCKKVLIADSIARIIDPALANYGALSTVDTWLCILGYTYQLYFDFSGYSDMAVGLGNLLNIDIPQNFDSPYKANGLRAFWSRWHISLSRCLRDYLYIPLGGNRGGDLSTYRNLLVTMALGGLWHGANLTFIVWGIYHGALQALQRWGGRMGLSLPPVAGRFVTFFLVVIGWIFFRSTSLAMSVQLLRRGFSWQDAASMEARPGLIALILGAALIAHALPNTYQMTPPTRPTTSFALAVLFGFAVFVISAGTPSPFLYFQF